MEVAVRPGGAAAIGSVVSPAAIRLVAPQVGVAEVVEAADKGQSN